MNSKKNPNGNPRESKRKPKKETPKVPLRLLGFLKIDLKTAVNFSCRLKYLGYISGSHCITATTGPVGVEKFTAGLVDAFVGVRSEIVALSLQ